MKPVAAATAKASSCESSVKPSPKEKSAGSHMSIRRLKAAPRVMRTTLGLRQNTQWDSSCPAAMNAARYSTAIISEKILPFMLELYHKGRPAIIKIYDHAMKYET